MRNGRGMAGRGCESTAFVWTDLVGPLLASRAPRFGGSPMVWGVRVVGSAKRNDSFLLAGSFDRMKSAMTGSFQKWRASAILFGSVMWVVTATAQNLLRNPGFESGTAGWGRYGPSEIETTNFSHSGEFAARVWNRSAKHCGINVRVRSIMVPGATYRCSGWARLENGVGQPVKMTIRQVDDENGGRPRFHNLTTNTATSDGWVELSATFTLEVVGTLSDLHLYFEGPKAGVNFLVDDVSVAHVSAPEETVVADLPGDRHGGHAPPVRSIYLRVKVILIGAVALGLAVIGIVLAALLASSLWKKRTASTRQADDVPEPPLLPPRDGPGP